MKDVTCPDCGKVIPVSEIQPAADLAICRACEKSFSLSQLHSQQELADINLDAKPKHVTLVNEMDGLNIVYRRIPGGFWFVLPFTCFWSGMSIWVIYIQPIFVQGKPLPVDQLLFGIPFLFGTLVLVTSLVCMLFGRRRIWIRPDGIDCGEISVFYGVGKYGRTKRIRYRSGTMVGLEEGAIQVNHRAVDDICIRNDEGDELRFGAMIPQADKRYVAALIQTTISG